LGNLAAGDYKWRVRAYDSAKVTYGDWTDYKTFTIPAPLPLGPLTAVSPAGTVTGFNNSFTWTGMTRATDYVIEVFTAADVRIGSPTWRTASQASCIAPDLDCATTIGLGNLAPGDYKWHVRAYDSATVTYGDWTAYQTFSIPAPQPLGPLTAISPAGSVSNYDNSFSWTGITRATDYVIEVYTSGDVSVVSPTWRTASQAACVAPDLDCATTVGLGNLAAGDYKWRVRAYDNATATYGAWTDYQAFTISAPPVLGPLGPLTAISPSGSVSNYDNSFSWTGITRATDYVIEV
jgi:hypothetical protein